MVGGAIGGRARRHAALQEDERAATPRCIVFLTRDAATAKEHGTPVGRVSLTSDEQEGQGGLRGRRERMRRSVVHLQHVMINHSIR